MVATEDQLAHAVTQLLYRTAPDDTSDTDDTTDTTEDAEEATSTTAPAFSSAYGSSTTSSTSTTVPANLSGISVDVTGASGRTGEAAAAAAWLQSLGATVVTSADDAATTEERSVVEYPTGDAGRREAGRRRHRHRQASRAPARWTG